MSADIVDLDRFRFTHERAPARTLTDAEKFQRALARQKIEDDSRWVPCPHDGHPYGGDAA